MYHFSGNLKLNLDELGDLIFYYNDKFQIKPIVSDISEDDKTVTMTWLLGDYTVKISMNYEIHSILNEIDENRGERHFYNINAKIEFDSIPLTKFIDEYKRQVELDIVRNLKTEVNKKVNTLIKD